MWLADRAVEDFDEAFANLESGGFDLEGLGLSVKV